jgi:YidC/Oxa1 family membrane protein insertase
MKKIIRLYKDFFKYKKINMNEKKITVFLEKQSDINYFDRFFDDLYKSLNIKIIIICSELVSLSDFKNQNYEKELIYIGDGFFRFLYFKLINTKIFFMTTPDLENSELKKSINPVKYFYVFHSPVSIHSIYNHNAFKYYDYILSSGVHHFNEIRYLEKFYKDKKKYIIPFGYPRILDLKEEYLSLSYKNNQNSKKKNILIAPSWGKSSITENCLEEIFVELIKADLQIIFRPHPISLIQNRDIIINMKKKFSNKVLFELDVSNTIYLNEIDLLITDWSGFSIEFFLTTKKPTLFIDTPPKINNKNFSELKLESLEKKIRTEIGEVLDLGSISMIKSIIKKLLSKKFKPTSKQYIYNYYENLPKTLDVISNILKEN